MDYAKRNMNNNNNLQSNVKTITKPVIATKPTNLTSVKKNKESGDNNSNTQLSRMGSLTHMTPKSWTKSVTTEIKEENTSHSKLEVKTSQEMKPKSPFEKKWRPAPQLNLNKPKTLPATQTKTLNTNKALEDETTVDAKLNIPDTEHKSLPKIVESKQLNTKVPPVSKNLLQVKDRGKQLNRSSFKRSPKSPGFDTIKKMFDAKPEESTNTKPKLKPTLSKQRSNQWQHVSSPTPYLTSVNQQSRNRSSSIEVYSPAPFKVKTEKIEVAQNTFKYDITSIQNKSQKDDIKITEEIENTDLTESKSVSSISPKDTESIETTNKQENESDNNDTIVTINQNIEVITDHDSDDYEKSFEEALDHQLPTGIYESLDDFTEGSPKTSTSYNFEGDEITSGVYEVQAEMEGNNFGNMVIQPPTSGSYDPQEYLPMRGSTLTSSPSIKYVEMKPKTLDIDEKYPVIDYSNQVVPAPVNVKSKREYHEIDPNVPPPPDREPPKLPSRGKSRPLSDDNLSSQPPPLPPDNSVGRRSKMYSKNKQLRIVNDLKEKLAKSNQSGQEKKLNYIEVEVTSSNNNSPQLPVRQKTNYSDVVVLSGGEFPQTRNRSGSGTSEEGLSSSTTKKTKKKKPFNIFSSKDNQQTESKSTNKDENEVLTDFGKERNKKKRISERILRKKKKNDKRNKKDQNSDDSLSKSFESDSGTYDVETMNTNSEQSGSASGVSGGSLQSSGDGEVATQGNSQPNINPTKMLPHDNSAPVSRRKSQDTPNSNPPLPRPRNTKKSLSQGQLGVTTLSYPALEEVGKKDNKNDAPKVQSFLHGSPKTTIKHEKSYSEPPYPNLLPRDSSLPRQDPPLPPREPLPTPRVNSNNEVITFPPDTNNGGDYKTGLMTSNMQRLMSRPHCPSPLVIPGQNTVTTPAPMVRVDGSSDQVSYDMAEDVAPPLPDRDDEVHPTSVVPPSPYTENDELGSSKFLNSEPLYQIYRDRTLSCASMARRTNRKTKRGEPVTEWKSEFMSEDLGTSTLWRSIPEVEGSSFLKEMTPQEIKLQQAQFEVLTSQASYLRSLNILVEHFMKDWAMESHDILPLKERHHLFSNIETVQTIEKKFLQELEKHFWKDLYLSKVCELVAKYAQIDFNVYVLYIQNQVYQDRVLTKLQRNLDNFSAELCRLEASPVCNKLPLLSFLMLPMQRVTRLPLLVSAIIKAADSANNKQMCQKAKHALGVVNKLVKKCNEGARKMQQTEQLAEIASQLDYSLSIKTFALVSQSRSLVKKGEMSVSMATDNKKATKTSKLWLFLFTDVLFIARKKSYLETGNITRFEVLDWCKRSTLCVNEKAVQDNVIFLVLLENQAGKRVEMTLNPVAQNELSRWTKALSPPTPSGEGESIYESWDCPQYVCVEPYEAQQPDELSIDTDDVMQVLKKTSDGWLEGERLRDGETGWFPIFNCKEIDDEHVRTRNMKNLYRTGLV